MLVAQVAQAMGLLPYIRLEAHPLWRTESVTKMIITIDGPAGTGKSTAARRLARALKFAYFDTGALYRAITWMVLENKVDFTDEENIVAALNTLSFRIESDGKAERYFVGNKEVTDVLRLPKVTAAVSQVAALEGVRKALKPIQREYACKGKAVFDGRDLGTAIFPDADLKFFLTASEEVRAKRRFLELSLKFPDQTEKFSYHQVMEDIRLRDRIDSSRCVAPLKKAPDAILIDTSDLAVDQVVDLMCQTYRKKAGIKLKQQSDKGSLLYRLVIWLTRSVFKLLYRYRVFGLENYPPGSALIAVNHTSFYDPPAVAAACPEAVHFVARETLFRSFLGKLIRKLNSHPISKGLKNISGVKTICRLLKEGKKVIIFPEGTRSKEGELAPIQRGTGLLFAKSEAAILPTYVHGTYSIWSRNRKLPKLFGKIVVVFGSPILWSHYEGKERKEIRELVSCDLERSLRRLKEWYEQGANGVPP
ncbi:MAG: (d)CMP kinase [Chlamydiota bacterium]